MVGRDQLKLVSSRAHMIKLEVHEHKWFKTFYRIIDKKANGWTRTIKIGEFKGTCDEIRREWL